MRTLFLFIFITILYLLSFKGTAQCTASLTADGECLPLNLELTSNTAPLKIILKRDGFVQSTFYPYWQPPSTAEQVRPSGDICVDKDGNVYSSNRNQQRVEKWVPGATSPIIVAGGHGLGSADQQLHDPGSIFLDNAGNLYICDENNYRIMKWAPGATSGVKVAGGNGPGTANNQLAIPEDVFVDDAGNVYITDAGAATRNDRVMKWLPGATTGIKVAGGNGEGSNLNQLNKPEGIWVTKNGDIYIVDGGNRRVQRWSPGATSGVTVAGGNGIGENLNQVHQSASLYVDENATIYLIHARKQIVRWLPGAIKGEIAVPSSFFSSNLPLITSFFIGSNGHLYIVSLENSIVRLFKLLLSKWKYNIGSGGTYGIEVVDANGCTAITNPLNIGTKSSPLLAISGPQNSLCAGTPATFAVSASDTGAAPTYQWKKNDINVGTNSKTYIDNAPNNNDKVSIYITNTENNCIARDSIISQVVQPPASVQISANSNCIPAKFTLNTPFTPAQLIWQIDEAPGDTSNINWKNEGTRITSGPAIDVFVDANDTIYTLEPTRVTKWAPEASVGIVVAGGNGQGSAANQLNSPRDLFVDKSGNIFIADDGNNRLLKWPRGATKGDTIAIGYSPSSKGLRGVFVDDDGMIYYTTVYTVNRCAPDGSFVTTVAGSVGGTAYTLNNPQGVFVDRQKNIYVADQTNHRVQKFLPDNLEGITVAGGNGNGSAANQTPFPRSIVVDAAGSVYVSSGNALPIRKWFAGATSAVDVCDSAGPIFIDSKANLYLAGGAKGVRRFSPNTSLTFTPKTQGNYTAKVSDIFNACRVNTNVIPLNAGPSPTATISINGEGFCKGDNITFLANTTNTGGTLPSYLWKVNNIARTTTANLSSSDLNNNDTISCIVTSSFNSCYTIADTVVSIKPLPVISLAASSTSLPANIIVSAKNVIPEIIWSRNGAVIDTTHNWKTNGITVAGSGGYGTGPTQLTYPDAGIVDEDGVVYTTDTRLRKWLPGSVSSTTIFPHSVYDVHKDKHGNLYTLALEAGGVTGVFKVDPNEVTSLIIRSTDGNGNNAVGNAPYQLNNPRGLTVDEDGNIYIADTDNNRVQKWAPGATAGITVAGGNGKGKALNQTAGPWDVTLDKSGNLYIVEATRITKWAQGASEGTIILPENFLLKDYPQPSNSSARNIYFDERGNFYYPQSNSVLFIKEGGGGARIVAGTGIHGSAADQLYQAKSAVFSTNGDMYVTDAFNDRIQKFTQDSAKNYPVTKAGLYKITATGFNGCSVKDSIELYNGTYTFNGSGSDWNNNSMWMNNTLPPINTLPAGYRIVIDPANGECILNGNLTVEPGATLKVEKGKSLKVSGNLTIK